MNYPRHNVLPEIAAKVVAVLQESSQTRGRLRDGPGCYCALGAFCEAYRRDHPDIAKWSIDGDNFVVRDWRHYCVYAPAEVVEWACGPDRHCIMVDGVPIEERNDHGLLPFGELIEILTDPGS